MYYTGEHEGIITKHMMRLAKAALKDFDVTQRGHLTSYKINGIEYYQIGITCIDDKLGAFVDVFECRRDKVDRYLYI